MANVRVHQHAGAGHREASTARAAPMAAFAGVVLAACVTGEGSSAPRGSSSPERRGVPADAPAADPRDLALLRRMTLREKVNQLMQFSAGPATGPDSAGR